MGKGNKQNHLGNHLSFLDIYGAETKRGERGRHAAKGHGSDSKTGRLLIKLAFFPLPALLIKSADQATPQIQTKYFEK